jgi:hypothetical protein
MDDLESELLVVHSRYAGLSFLCRVLEERGIESAAAGLAATLPVAVHLALRGVLRSSGFSGDDAAAWVLAGLSGAPSDDELALEVDACDRSSVAAFARAGGATHEASGLDDAAAVWSASALTEVAERLSAFDPSLDVASDILEIPGTITSLPDALEISMPFTRAYDALLRCGLSFDEPSVSWLDGRSLRFTFEDRS